MKVHNDYNLDLVDGATYWAATRNYDSETPIVVPVTLNGTAPFMGLTAPQGMYNSEWWLLSLCEIPRVRVIERGGKKVVALADVEEICTRS